MMDVVKIAKRYMGIGLLLIIFLWLCGVMVDYFKPEWHLMPAVWLSTVFSIVVLVTFTLIWKKVANNNTESLTTVYSYTSAFRMLLALFTLVICYFVVGRSAMLVYVVVFMLFYIVMIGFHSIYFSRITNRL